MNEFWSHYWIPNSEIPRKEFLILFTIIHIAALVYLLSVYYFVRRKILRSISGPSKFAQAKIPPLLHNSINLIFLSLFLIEISILKVHFSALLFPGNGYFMVGASDPFLGIGILLLPLGIFNLLEEITKSNQFNSFRFVRPYSILVIITMLTFNIVFIFDLALLLYGVVVILAIALAVYFIMIFLSFKVHTNRNQITELRLKIMRLPLILQVFYLTIALFYLPRGPVETWNTRNNNVELLFLTSEVLVLLVTSCIYVTVVLPRWFRRVIGINLVEYLKSRDFRFDFDWEPMEHMVRLDDRPADTEIHTESADILIVHSGGETTLISEELSSVFNAEYVHVKNIFREEYLASIKLPKSDIVIITDQDAIFTKYLLEHVWNNYKLKIDISDRLCVNDYFVFESSDYEFAFLGIFPSLWNVERKIWLLLSPSLPVDPMVNFISRYFDYYKYLQYNQALFGILRFPIQNGMTLPIPSAFESLDIPNQSYIHIL